MFKKRDNKKRSFTISELVEQPECADEANVDEKIEITPLKRQKICTNSTSLQKMITKEFVAKEVQDLTKVHEAPKFDH
jgi:hypothetical protein